MNKVLDGIASFMIGAIVIGLIGLLLAYPTKWLWNYLMPVIFMLPKIHAGQALGLLILSGLFFRSNSSSKD